VRGFLKLEANITPRWIENARTSRKRIEPEIARMLRALKDLRRSRPRAQVALRNANKELKTMLAHWEETYSKENFYRGIRILLELERDGNSNL
jgi:hypothetical protein